MFLAHSAEKLYPKWQKYVGIFLMNLSTFVAIKSTKSITMDCFERLNRILKPMFLKKKREHKVNILVNYNFNFKGYYGSKKESKESFCHERKG